jgi:hypothetical protein
MIYFSTAKDQYVLIVEPSNLDALRAGEPMKTPDKKFLVVYVPDMEWFAKRFGSLVTNGAGEVDVQQLDDLIKEAQKQHVIRR